MYRTFIASTTLVPVLLLFCISGCSDSKKSATKADAHAEKHGDEHASKGPHGGSLIELGEEEFHAELVHDEKAGTVTVYVLDGKAKASSPIDAKEITINVTHEGRGEQHKLAASPDAGDPPGKSSRFASSEAELVKDLDTEGVKAQMAVSINGKPFNAAIEHDHGHEGK